jgi:hypothetical protein
MPAKVCVEFTEGDGNGGPTAPGARFYSATIGDGTSLNYTVTHGFGTRDVLVSLRNIVTGELDGYDASVSANGDNSVSVTFVTAPATGSVRVLAVAGPVE